MRDGWSGIKDAQSAAMAVVEEVLGSVRVVKAFGQEEREQRRLLRHFREGVRGQVRLALLEGGVDILVGLTVAMGSAAVLLVGARHVSEGRITLGDLLLVIAYLSHLYRPLEKMSKGLTQVQSALAGAERAFALLDREPDVPEAAHSRPLLRAAGAVVYRDVSFAYKGGPHVLHHVSFEVEPGTRVGVVGRTGSGKSTLVSLLTRFYDPTSGSVLLDGEDIRAYRLADLRSQFAIVLQEPVLFSTTIAENIAYARAEATE
jgi:ATP-binding cassette subfamily B protein